MGTRCSYSREEIIAGDITSADLPVECPICGAIRKVTYAPPSNGFAGAYIYPSHDQVDFVRLRRRWSRAHGVWAIVE